jgi:hypothetical protein
MFPKEAIILLSLLFPLIKPFSQALFPYVGRRL